MITYLVDVEKECGRDVSRWFWVWYPVQLIYTKVNSIGLSLPWMISIGYPNAVSVVFFSGDFVGVRGAFVTLERGFCIICNLIFISTD